MAAMIKFTLKELKELISDDKSCVHVKNVIQNIALPPWGLTNLKQSLTKIFDWKIGKYDRELDGIIISYKNVKMLNDLGTIRNDSAEIYSDVQVDLYVFQPQVGTVLRGVINKKSITHLGILVHRMFNVVIPKPTDQAWVGSQLSVGQTVFFEIIVVDLFGALPYIRGSLDESSLPPLDDDDIPNNTSDEERLKVTHVNFDGIKPQMVHNASSSPSSIFKTDMGIKSKSSKSSKVDELPKRRNKSTAIESPTTAIRENINIGKNKSHVENSESDSISDVDDDIMINQASIIKKIMERERLLSSIEKAKMNKMKELGIRISETPSSNIHETKPKKLEFESSTPKPSLVKAATSPLQLEIQKLAKKRLNDLSSTIKSTNHDEIDSKLKLDSTKSDVSESSDSEEKQEKRIPRDNVSLYKKSPMINRNINLKSSEMLDKAGERNIKVIKKTSPKKDSPMMNIKKVSSPVCQSKIKNKSKVNDSESIASRDLITKEKNDITTFEIVGKSGCQKEMRKESESDNSETDLSSDKEEIKKNNAIIQSENNSPSRKIKAVSNSLRKSIVKLKKSESSVSDSSDSEIEVKSDCNSLVQTNIQKILEARKSLINYSPVNSLSPTESKIKSSKIINNSNKNIKHSPDFRTEKLRTKLNPDFKSEIIKVGSPDIRKTKEKNEKKSFKQECMKDKSTQGKTKNTLNTEKPGDVIKINDNTLLSSKSIENKLEKNKHSFISEIECELTPGPSISKKKKHKHGEDVVGNVKKDKLNLAAPENINNQEKKPTPNTKKDKKNKDISPNIHIDDKNYKVTPYKNNRTSEMEPTFRLPLSSCSESSVDISELRNMKSKKLICDSKYNSLSNNKLHIARNSTESDSASLKNKRKSKQWLTDEEHSQKNVTNSKKRKYSQMESDNGTTDCKVSKKNKKMKNRDVQDERDDDISSNQYLAYLDSDPILKKQIQLLIRKRLSME